MLQCRSRLWWIGTVVLPLLNVWELPFSKVPLCPIGKTYMKHLSHYDKAGKCLVCTSCIPSQKQGFVDTLGGLDLWSNPQVAWFIYQTRDSPLTACCKLLWRCLFLEHILTVAKIAHLAPSHSQMLEICISTHTDEVNIKDIPNFTNRQPRATEEMHKQHW